MKKCILLLVIIFCLLTINSWGSTSKKGIIAEVGPYKLYKSDLDEIVRNRTEITQILGTHPELLEYVYKTLIEEWINISMLALEAKKENLDKNSEIQKRIKEITKRILAEGYIKKHVANIKINEEELKEYYEKNKNNYKIPQGVKIKHILIYVPKDADEKIEQQAFEKALKIRKKILEGTSFEEMVEKYSEDIVSKRKGGDFGIIRKGKNISKMAEEIFKLKTGEISKPLRSLYGYHIVKVVEKIPAKILAYNEVKEEVKKDYLKEKQNKLIKQILSDLKNKYHPKIYYKKENDH
ncbi:MAG: hypothetical protein DRP29_02410 [Thermodesulfobacteriota bacterium]|nr:MAG: hypothetical protein DRP29_02410 [Thermodesulfobacteriota bacterium]